MDIRESEQCLRPKPYVRKANGAYYIALDEKANLARTKL